MKTSQRLSGIVLMTVLLAAIWYLLSGKFDVLHFGSGVVTALVLAVLYRPVPDRTVWRVGRFLLYIPWLIGQIMLSNLRVARMVLMPRMPIAPTFIRLRPGVTGPRALTLLGTSITLTPGTLTVDVHEDEIFIHALDTASAEDVRDRIIEHRVAEVFPVREAT
jgi:multicomponent Na+:H+ antiporter subunit E